MAKGGPVLCSEGTPAVVGAVVGLEGGCDDVACVDVDVAVFVFVEVEVEVEVAGTSRAAEAAEMAAK